MAAWNVTALSPGIRHIFDQVTLISISLLVNKNLRVLQKLLKYFNDKILIIFYAVWPAAMLPVNLITNLNYFEFASVTATGA